MRNKRPWLVVATGPVMLWVACDPGLELDNSNTPECFVMGRCKPAPVGGGGEGGIGCEPPPPSRAVAPDGWRRWPHTPDDCAIFVPDDLSSVVPITWEPCPFMPEGCVIAGAPWAAEANWGYGTTIQVASSGRDTYVRLARRLAHTYEPGFEHWWESIVLRNDVIHRVRAYDSAQSQCGVREELTSGRATTLVSRTLAFGCPLYYEEPIDQLADEHPGELIEFHRDIFPGGHTAVSGPWRIFEELSPSSCFVAVNKETGLRCRSCVPDWTNSMNVGGLDAHRGMVHYRGYIGSLGAAMLQEPCGYAKPLLMDDAVSYEHLTSDGKDYVWVKATGFQGQTGVFDTFELWTAPFVTDPAELAPRKVKDLDLPAVLSDLLSLGEGWAGVRYSGYQDIRLVRLEDGAEKRLPVVDGVAYAAGRDSLVIHRGHVWIAAYPFGAAGNDIRWILRFDIGSLSDVE